MTLTTEQLMKFQITEIEFDFDDCPYCGENQSPEHDADCDGFVEVLHIKKETIGQIWEADDEDDLVEEITCATGWCIKSIDYRHVLS
jgi:hypothetical protein